MILKGPINHNDELGYKPSSSATFQDSLTMKVPCLTFKGFQSPTVKLYFIEMITIVMDCCMLINKMMFYYINEFLKIILDIM
jgi:hypothetical protein